MIDDPGAADDGLFARDAEGKPLVLRQAHAGAGSGAYRADITPALVGEFTLADGRRAVRCSS